MNWFYSTRYFDSEINGRIQVRRFLGTYTVKVHGEAQSSPYTDTMWRVAMRRITRHAHIKHVLLLGLGGASSLRALFQKFPHAHVTIVEWDPAMLELCRSLHLLKHPEQTHVLIGDVRDIVPALSQKFDLIIFDLFSGNKISPTIIDAQSQQSIIQRLAPNGYYLVNFWLGGKHEPEVAAGFTTQDKWRFRINTFALYRPPLPTGYERYRAYADFQKREARLQTRHQFFASGSTHGLRSKTGPLCFEKYVGNTEPDISKWPHPRLITWHPTSKLPKPKGWHASSLYNGTKSYGIAHITNLENHWADWSSRAKRQRKQWLEHDSKEWSITEVTNDEFFTAFKKAKLGVGLVGILARLVKYKQMYHGPLVKLFGAKKQGSSEIHAGLAVLHIPEASTSLHLAAFHLPAARETSVGTALIDTWFQEAIANNITYLDFGTIRANSEPRDWQGFTDFKNQFLTHTIFTPKPFFKFKGKSK
jgi:trans-aconitate methyltransferase